MNKLLYAVIGVLYLIYIFNKVRNKRMSEKESIIWVIISIVILILSIFPGLSDKFALYIGVAYGPSILFLMSIFGISFLLLRKEEQITDLNIKIREMAQKIALLEQKINEKKN